MSSTEEVTETTDEQGTDDNGPDISEQVADLSTKFERFIESQQEPAQETDPADLLNFELPDEEIEGYEEPDYDYEDEPQVDPRLEALEEMVVRREMEDRTNKLRELGDKYPDLREEKTLNQVKATLDSITDDPALRSNPVLVENVYLALKAQAEAEAETPAEEARSRGARLETDASAGAPTEEDPDAEFKKAFREVAKSGDILD